MRGCIKWLFILGGFAFVVFVIIVAANVGATTATKKAQANVVPTATPDAAQVKAAAAAIDYKDLHRNIEAHVSKTIHFQGVIVQSSGATELFGDDYTVFRVMLDSGDVIWTEYHGEERFLEDDTVEVWATVNGLHTYETVLGAAVELPRVTVRIMELIPQ